MNAAPERQRLGRLRDRAGDLPGVVADVLPLLRRPGADLRDPDPRREHVVPGLPAPRRRSWLATASSLASSSTSATGSSTRTGSSSSPAIAALLIWAFKADVIALIHLYVIGVFTAFTISQAGMVKLLAAARAAGLALARDRQRHRRRGDRRRRDRRGRVEVHRGSVGRHRRDPDPDRLLLRRPAPLQQGRAATSSGCRGRRRRAAGDEQRRPLRRVVRRRPGGGGVVRTPDRGRRLPRDPRARVATPTLASVPRFRQFTGMRPDLEIVNPEDGRVDAVIDYLWALPRGESQLRDDDRPGALPSPVARRRRSAAPSSR